MSSLGSRYATSHWNLYAKYQLWGDVTQCSLLLLLEYCYLGEKKPTASYMCDAFYYVGRNTFRNVQFFQICKFKNIIVF